MRFKVKNALKEIIIMNTNKKILLIITFLLIMCTGISISYAFFKVASSNNNANTNVNIVDLGYPGTLPTLNKEVVEMALKAALALNCKINKRMHFDRKNYFYPDLPKGYQITQQATPIGYDGYLEIEVDGVSKRIGIERIHIEEDTCKSMHVGENTLLNYNRAGVPLIEIVTKPDIKSSKEATTYVEELRKTLLYLGISDVKIEEGSMKNLLLN